MNTLSRALVALAACLLSFTAQAEQPWPSHIIKATIPFGAGSATDGVPRLVFDRLSADLGQTIIVENRAGAGGTLGTGIVAKADPDGYNILPQSPELQTPPEVLPHN